MVTNSALVIRAEWGRSPNILRVHVHQKRLKGHFFACMGFLVVHHAPVDFQCNGDDTYNTHVYIHFEWKKW